MLRSTPQETLVPLDVDQPIWERFFTVAPLVVVGSRNQDGSYDLAPKHMAMPLGWENYFGFICTPRHQTYHNIKRDRVFTVSYPSPSQVLAASLSAAPRDSSEAKPSLAALPTRSAQKIEGIFLDDATLYLECQVLQIIDGFGTNSLIAGHIIAAHVRESALREADKDDQDLIRSAPLLAYLSPGRYTPIDHSYSFPFHQGFQR